MKAEFEKLISIFAEVAQALNGLSGYVAFLFGVGITSVFALAVYALHLKRDRRLRAAGHEEILLSQQKQEMKEVVSIVSHDFRAPLITVNGFVEAIGNAIETGDLTPTGDHLKRIRNSVELLDQQLQSVVRFCRLRKAQEKTETMVLLDLKRVVSDAVAPFSDFAERKNLRFELGDKMPEIYGYEEEIRTMFEWLISHILLSPRDSGTQSDSFIRVNAEALKSDLNLIDVSVRSDYGDLLQTEQTSKLFDLSRHIKMIGSEEVGFGLAGVRKIAESYLGGAQVQPLENGREIEFRIQLAHDSREA